MRHALTLLILPVLAGCSDPVRPGSMLTGLFGGENIELTANAQHAQVRFGCNAAVTGPLVFDENGDAHATGATGLVAGQPGLDATVDVHFIAADVVNITVRVQQQSSEAFSALRGRQGEFTMFCLD